MTKTIDQRVMALLCTSPSSREAVRRALEAHDATKAEFEAYKRDVSGMATSLKAWLHDTIGPKIGHHNVTAKCERLACFILPEPVDPLEALAAEVADNEAGVFRNAYTFNPDSIAHCIALAGIKRGLTITKGNPDEAE